MTIIQIGCVEHGVARDETEVASIGTSIVAGSHLLFSLYLRGRLKIATQALDWYHGLR